MKTFVVEIVPARGPRKVIRQPALSVSDALLQLSKSGLAQHAQELVVRPQTAWEEEGL